MVALVVGGRHPGHYFLDSDDFNDVVTRLDTCIFDLVTKIHVMISCDDFNGVVTATRKRA